jgi:Protein of unknown function (DUF3106)
VLKRSILARVVGALLLLGIVAGSAHAQSLVALAQPLWSELSPAQKQVLGPFETQWNALPVKEKKAWVKLSDDLPKMSAQQQTRARQRIKDWANLSPNERKLARDNYRLATAVPKSEQNSQYQSYRSLTPDQRGILRSAGDVSNTAAGHAGSRTGLAKEAAQPIPAVRKGQTVAANAASKTAADASTPASAAISAPAATIKR